jgi:hypothetical protein
MWRASQWYGEQKPIVRGVTEAMVNGWVPTQEVANQAIKHIDPEDREAFLKSVQFYAASKQKANQRGAITGAVTSLAAGAADLGAASEDILRTLGAPVTKEDLTDDQKIFARKVYNTWNSENPITDPEASWVTQGAHGVARMAVPITAGVLAAGAAGPAMGAMGTAPIAQTAVKGALAVAPFTPDMRNAAYDTAIERGSTKQEAEIIANVITAVGSALYAGVAHKLTPGWLMGTKGAKTITEAFINGAKSWAGGTATMGGVASVEEAIQQVAEGKLDANKVISAGFESAKEAAKFMAWVALPRTVGMALGVKKDIPPLPSNLSPKVRAEIKRAGELGDVPSRKQFGEKGWMLDLPQGVGSMRWRANVLKAWSAEIRNRDAATFRETETLKEVMPEPISPETLADIPKREGVVEGPVPVRPEPVEMAPVDPTKGSTMKHANIDELWTSVGRSIPDEYIPQRDQRNLDQAQAELNANPNFVDDLLARYEKKPFPPSTIEGSALLIRKNEMNRQRRKLSADQSAAFESGDAGAADIATEALANIDGKLYEYDTILRGMGSERGSALRNQRIFLFEDFTIEGMTEKVRNAKGGAPLTPQENIQIAELSRRLQEAEAKLERMDLDTKVNSVINESKDKRSLFVKVAQKDRFVAAKKELDLAWDEFKLTMPGAESVVKFAKGEEGTLKIGGGAGDWDVFKVGKVNVVRNPTTADIREMNAAFRERWPNAPTGSIKVRSTFDMEGNKYSWMSDASHDQVEPEINRRYRTETDQNQYFSGKKSVDSAVKFAKGGELLKGESGALNVDMLKAGAKLAKAYIDLGVVSFSEFYEVSREYLGGKSEIYRDTLLEAWDKVKKESGIPLLRMEPGDRDSMIRVAKRLTRSVVQSGITDRDKVVAEVWKEMKNIIPDITERQVKESITRYGINPELPSDAVSIVAADLSGQLLQLLKLEDMAAGRAPLATGARREISQDERQLIKQVNEAKKRGNFLSVDFAKQLKTALESSKTAVRNSLTDMAKEIKDREKIVRERRSLTPDAELIALKAKQVEMRKIWNDIFPKKPMSTEQKVAASGRALDRYIAQLESEVRTLQAGGVVQPGEKAPPISTPELEVKRARIDVLKGQREVLKEAANPKMSKEERDNLSYKNSLRKRLSDLQQKISTKDFSEKIKKEKVYDKETVDLRFEMEQTKARFQKMVDANKKKLRGTLQRAWEVIPEGLNFSRAVLTSMDLSAVLRQGAATTFSHPILTLRATPEMIRSFGSSKAAFRAKLELEARENSRNGLYRVSKLALTSVEGSLTHQEEVYYGSWAKRVPGVAGSERAYVGFLNRMRADVFDSMVSSLGRTGKVTHGEAKVIANWVNVATGRGDFGMMNSASSAMATVFFAPRYALSRFQLLFGQPVLGMWGKDTLHGTMRARKAVAMEYGRMLMGLGMVYGLALLYNEFNPDDPIIFEGNFQSSDAGKLRMGDTRIDPMAGVAQATVLLTRIVTGKTKGSTGKIIPISGDDVPFGGMTIPGAIGNFLRNKLSPGINLALEIRTGKTPVGEPTTGLESLGRNLLPLSFRDIYSAMQDQGATKGTALTMLILLGMGSQVYEGATKSKFAEHITEHSELYGRNEKTHEIFDYRAENEQVVAQAQKLGYSLADLESAMVAKMREDRQGQEAIDNARSRLRRRFRQ